MLLGCMELLKVTPTVSIGRSASTEQMDRYGSLAIRRRTSSIAPIGFAGPKMIPNCPYDAILCSSFKLRCHMLCSSS